MEARRTREKPFRFQDLDIWQRSIELGDRLLDTADRMERQHLFRFAEQIRGAALSVSNNIAEGSGSDTNREFARFLGIARKSVYENANMMIIFERRNLVTEQEANDLLDELEQISRMIEAFRKYLYKNQR